MRMIGGWRVCPDWARAVGRFNPHGPDGYRAATMPDAPLRATREEAIDDEVRYRLGRSAGTYGPEGLL